LNAVTRQALAKALRLIAEAIEDDVEVERTALRGLSTAECAEQLGCCEKTVIRYIERGEIQAINVGQPGHRPRYKVQQRDLDSCRRRLHVARRNKPLSEARRKSA
jgi:excisionase family DNA binding protein